MPDNKLKGEFVLTPENNTNTDDSSTLPGNAAAKKNTEHNHTHSKPKFYSSMALYPDNFTFQNQEADEEVVLLVRRDFITNLPWIISIILLSILPVVVFLLAPIFFPSLSISQTLIILSLVFYFLVLFGFAMLNFAIWYFNAGIVTTKRVIDVDVPNILVRVLSEARLPSIVDVTYTQVGGIRSFFDYGDIFIQTEGIHQNIEFDRAPSPNTIRRIIGELVVDKPV